MFLADLISNCFFEVSDVNILYFLGFQSFTDVVVPPMFCMFLGLAVGVIVILFAFLKFHTYGELYGEH